MLSGRSRRSDSCPQGDYSPVGEKHSSGGFHSVVLKIDAKCGWFVLQRRKGLSFKDSLWSQGGNFRELFVSLEKLNGQHLKGLVWDGNRQGGGGRRTQDTFKKGEETALEQ